MWVLYQNEFIKREDVHIDMEDRGYQFGDGVYEVVRVYNGRCFRLIEHTDRLVASASSILLNLPHTKEEINAMLEKLVQLNQLGTGYIYLQYTRGVAPRYHGFPESTTPVLTAYVKEKPIPEKMLAEGIDVILAEDIRWLRCDIKSLNLLGAVLSYEQAKKAGKEEAILHRNQIVTECSLANIFMIKNKEIITHPVTTMILNGITRRVTLELADKHGYIVNEREFTVTELLGADEVFATGTTIEVMPVVSIDDQPVGNRLPGTITKELQALFANERNSFETRT
ncbi:D-amino-acid transaminase [Bacillus alkalicellulosilyticus]|uniref:D-amino-acid transaminase n=1 Tax=Alkalihalobacterium alkalicellulosilyticum TaxID=1912214 RepID=UPI0009979465|nr:D-amino-acid transaminase [Bacillus alkalicellulosilyticus]